MRSPLCILATLVPSAALAVAVRALPAQGAPPSSVAPTPAPAPASSFAARGLVRTTDGRPIAAATVVVLETLDETRTDSIGRFALPSAHRGLATVVARGVGFVPATVDVTLPVDSALTFVLTARPPVLSQFVVVAAGEYTIGGGQTATLTPLDVVQTPGAAGNIARAIQTLPGAQGVDEGTGLFVRGGDVTETRVLVDDAWLLSPVRADNPTGHTTTTVNPFLLDRTVFSSGGFGAGYGNALSGLVRMESASAPLRRSGSVSASIGGVSAAFGARPTERLGVRVAAGVSTLSPLIAVFGEAQPYDPPPRGHDASGTLDWRTSAAGRLRLFAVRQQQRFGVGDAAAQGAATYAARSDDGIAVLSWRDSSTAWRPAITAALSTFDRRETFGPTGLRTRLASPQLLASLGYRTARGTLWRIGAEREGLRASYAGTATQGDVVTPTFGVRTPSTRTAAFAEATHTFAAGVRVIGGVRSDHSTLTARRTVDPRLSLAWQRGALGLTAAWGTYHQVAEPTFRRALPARDFAPMRVVQAMAGVQWGSDSSGVRLEVYDKRYDALWQFTPAYAPVGGGVGHARGVDLQWRWRVSDALRTRITWSHVHARRTAPGTDVVAPSLADVSHSAAWITERIWRGITIGTALRLATGRPFTDIVGTDRSSGMPEPVYGAPFGARLPTYRRSDLSASWYRALGDRRGLVLWGSASNVFVRRNVMRYRWTDDFATRLPVQAPFLRSLFVGSTLLF
ncbi:MAG: TonB-dependent receptor [Gemmatimonadetes bacterium]|nr:TonB-dependent receptor [Gemmatimonadota bacterium]